MTSSGKAAAIMVMLAVWAYIRLPGYRWETDEAGRADTDKQMDGAMASVRDHHTDKGEVSHKLTIMVAVP
jgi:hypothetical protein